MKHAQVSLSQIWKRPSHFLAFGFGVGTVSWAPGTFGTLVAIPFYLVIAPLPWSYYLALQGILFVWGCWLCGKTCFDMGVHDHRGVVFDEMVGFWLTMFAAPPGWLPIVVGFVLFRLFDITKPWPIAWLDQRVAGGLGVMLDDVVAALYAWAVMQILLLLL